MVRKQTDSPRRRIALVSPVVSALVAGLARAWAGAVIGAFPYRVQPLDPVTLATVGVSLLILACGVSLRPALRAARVDLAAVLKVE